MTHPPAPSTDARPTWPDLLSALVARHSLDRRQTGWAMGEILAGQASPVQIAAFAVALRVKGETVDELTGLADAMLAAATPLTLTGPAVDVVGTGADRANTVNISTMAALVAAAAGATVAKHGNRASSSACGTADVLEALGVALDVPPQAQQQVLDAAGIVFLFAPRYHPSLRHASAPRKELAIPTTFNYLGPLANPARPAAQAVGVADADTGSLIAGVLAARGTRGMVFHGGDGLDELTTTTDSTVWLVADGRVTVHRLDPREVGLPRAVPEQLVGGDAQHNADVVRHLLTGATGPVRDIVVLNAAAALLAFDGPDHDTDLAEQVGSRVHRAARAIDDGAAQRTLDAWVAASRRAVTGP